MLDFQPLREKKVTLNDFIADITIADLRHLTHEMIDHIGQLIANCVDDDVTFEPLDPGAVDKYAIDPAEVNIAWTLGHLIVHVTASSEESAALATELARGVEHHGRSRYETPWRTVTTMAQCRQRLEESRRIRLASLDMWPDTPHLDNTYQNYAGDINAIGRFILGLRHDHDHLAQIANVVRQSQAARGGDETGRRRREDTLPSIINRQS